MSSDSWEYGALEDQAFLQDAVNKLSARFDSVQVVATRPEGEMTMTLYAGFGNMFAREGSVRDWLKRQEILKAIDIQRGG